MFAHRIVLSALTAFAVQTLSPSSPAGTIELYENNETTGDYVGSVDDTKDREINFKGNRRIERRFVNDEAKSLVLRHPRVGTVIRLFDSPDGDRDDDYVVIYVRETAAEIRVNTFEEAIPSGKIRVVYHRKNDLDGKVSRLEVDAGDPPARGSAEARYETIMAGLDAAFNGFPQKRGNAFEWREQDSNYRLWRPVVTFRADGGLTLSAKLNHIRNNAGDDSAVLSLKLDSEGVLQEANILVSISRLINDDSFSKSAQNLNAVAAALAGTANYKAALITAAVANLAALTRAEIGGLGDGGGRLYFPTAIEHVQEKIAVAILKAFDE